MTDTLVSPDTTPPPPAPISTPTASGGGFSSWSRNKKIAVVGGGGIVVALVVYLYAKKKSAAASTAATSSNSTTPTLVLPSSNQDATDSSNYASLAEGLNGLSSQVSAIQDQSTPTPTTTTTPPASTGPSGPPQYSTNYDALSGQLLDIVGVGQPSGAYKGYNVGEGVPVYALVKNGQGHLQWELNTKPSEWSTNTPLATPASDAQAIEWQKGVVTETLH